MDPILDLADNGVPRKLAGRKLCFDEGSGSDVTGVCVGRNICLNLLEMRVVRRGENHILVAGLAGND